jgi:hypothetical protein
MRIERTVMSFSSSSSRSFWQHRWHVISCSRCQTQPSFDSSPQSALLPVGTAWTMLAASPTVIIGSHFFGCAAGIRPGYGWPSMRPTCGGVDRTSGRNGIGGAGNFFRGIR